MYYQTFGKIRVNALQLLASGHCFENNIFLFVNMNKYSNFLSRKPTQWQIKRFSLRNATWKSFFFLNIRLRNRLSEEGYIQARKSLEVILNIFLILSES